MKLKLSTLSLGAVIAPLFLAQSLLAQFIEVGDAGESPSTAQQVGSGNGPINSITGSFNNVSDADLYRIFIANPATFSATTNNSVSLVDTQLFVFSLSGQAFNTNDESPEGANFVGGNPSTLPVGAPFRPTAPGFYLIGISLFGYNPVDSTNQLLFAESTNPMDIRGPNPNTQGPPLAGFSADSTSPTGGYRIDFTGATIPEPSTWALIVFGAAISGVAALRHRKLKSAGNVSQS